MVQRLDRDEDMVLDLLLLEAILGRLVQPRCRSCIPAAKAYRKVLKHQQLGKFQIRTVSRSTSRGSLGKEMGKLLGKPVDASGVLRKCSPTISTHLTYMTPSEPCDGKPCLSQRPDGVSLR